MPNKLFVNFLLFYLEKKYFRCRILNVSKIQKLYFCFYFFFMSDFKTIVMITTVMMIMMFKTDQKKNKKKKHKINIKYAKHF